MTTEPDATEWADAAATKWADYQRILAEQPHNHIAAGVRERGLAEMVPHLAQGIRDMQTRVGMWQSCVLTTGEHIADALADAERAMNADDPFPARDLLEGLMRRIGYLVHADTGVKGDSFDRWFLGLDEFEDSRDVVSREWTVNGLPSADFTGIDPTDVESAKAIAAEALDRRGYRVARWETVADDTHWVLGPPAPDHYVAHVEPIGPDSHHAIDFRRPELVADCTTLKEGTDR